MGKVGCHKEFITFFEILQSSVYTFFLCEVHFSNLGIFLSCEKKCAKNRRGGNDSGCSTCRCFHGCLYTTLCYPRTLIWDDYAEPWVMFSDNVFFF